MKHLLRTPRYIFVCASLVVATTVLWAQDPSKVSKAFTEKVNNDQVQVFEYHSKPGDKEAMHSHRPNVVYVVQGGKERFTTSDGKTQEREFKTGEVIYRDATTHSVENIGTTEMRAIIVELKAVPKK